MSTTYLKSDLIAELAQTAGISKRKADIILNQLTQIVYRESKTGFILPGICKLDVVRRKARRTRIPSTGQWIMIGEHDALRTRPLQRAKHAVAPKMPGLVQFIEAPEATPAPADVAETPTPAAPQSAMDGHPYNPEGLVSFRCGACGQEIEAPFDMAGTDSACPSCNGRIEVPYVSEPGTIWGRAIQEPKPPTAPVESPDATPFADPAPKDEAKMGRTIRIELPDDV